MTHRATLHLDMVRMDLQPALFPIRLLGRGAMIDVEYSHQAPAPDAAGDVDVLVPKSARLVHALVLQDSDRHVLVSISAGFDLLESLTRQQLDWVVEQLPIP